MPNGNWRCIGNEGEHLPGYNCHDHPGRRTPMTIPVINSDRIVPGQGADAPDVDHGIHIFSNPANNYEELKFVTDDDGEVPTLSGRQLRRSVSLSSDPDAETPNSKVNQSSNKASNQPKPCPVMVLAIIGLIFYLIFK